MLKGKIWFLGMFDLFHMLWFMFWCLWSILYVAMTVWCALWLFRSVSLVKNAVEWRKTVAGTKCRKYPGPDRPYPMRTDPIEARATRRPDPLYFEGHDLTWRHEPLQARPIPRMGEARSDDGDPTRKTPHDPTVMTTSWWLRTEPGGYELNEDRSGGWWLKPEMKR